MTHFPTLSYTSTSGIAYPFISVKSEKRYSFGAELSPWRIGHYKEYLPGVVRNNNNKNNQKSNNWMSKKKIWNNLLFICFDFLGFISRSVCCFIYFSIVVLTLRAKDLTGYTAIKLAMYLISCISTNLSPPRRLPLGIPIIIIIIIMMMMMMMMMITTRVGRLEEGKGGKKAPRVSLFPLPIVPSALSFFFLSSLLTTQKGVLATTTAKIAKTSLLKWISLFSNFVAFILIRWKCLM